MNLVKLRSGQSFLVNVVNKDVSMFKHVKFRKCRQFTIYAGLIKRCQGVKLIKLRSDVKVS